MAKVQKATRKQRVRIKPKRSDAVWAYLRVSTEEQSLEGQKLAIHDYANRKKWTIDRFVALKVSSTKSEKQRLIDELKQAAAEGQFSTLVVSELSRLGRGSSLGEIPRMIEHFTKHGVALHAIKEGIDTSKDDVQTTILVSVFSMFAVIERKLISERTRVALAARAASGVKLGRPAGVSKLDRHGDEIRELVQLGVKQKHIAKRIGCTEATLSGWLKRHKQEWLALG